MLYLQQFLVVQKYFKVKIIIPFLPHKIIYKKQVFKILKT